MQFFDSRSRRRRGSDDGFSLVEAVVALAIATAIFTALAFALVGGAKAGLLSQQNQQAGDVLNQAVEDARSLTYGELAMRQGDLDAGEPSRSPAVSAGFYNSTSDSTVEDTSTAAVELEPLAPRDPNGAVFPHVTTVSQNGRDFTVRRYVTTPTDAAGAVYKRLTVVVTWNGLGKERKRIYSTLVADTVRGLPLPDFKFKGTTSLAQCRNPGSSLAYAFRLENNGARDAWSLTPTVGGWSYYRDVDGNGAYDSSVDQALTGGPDTGLIEPTASRDLLAVSTVPVSAATPLPYSYTTVFRATSVAQPTYWQELTTTTTVQSAPCGAASAAPTATASPTSVATSAPTATPTTAPVAPAQPGASCASLTGAVGTSAPGGTSVRYYPGNPSQPGNTVASTAMPVVRDSGSAPAAGPLYNFSTDLHTVAGRQLQTGTTSSTTASQVASWEYAMPASSVIKGTGEVTLWAKMASGSTTARPSFTVVLEHLASNGTLIQTLGTTPYTTPASGWGCAEFRPLSLGIINHTGGGITIAANEKLRLRVVLTSADPVVLAYGTAAYPMTFTVPFKTGLG